MIYAVVLLITVWNYDTGDKLFESQPQKFQSLKDCYEAGLPEAYKIANEYRKTYSNASANVSCKWVKQ